MIEIEPPSSTLAESPFKGKIIQISPGAELLSFEFKDNKFWMYVIRIIAQKEWSLGLTRIFQLSYKPKEISPHTYTVIEVLTKEHKGFIQVTNTDGGFR